MCVGRKHTGTMFPLTLKRYTKRQYVVSYHYAMFANTLMRLPSLQYYETKWRKEYLWVGCGGQDLINDFRIRAVLFGIDADDLNDYHINFQDIAKWFKTKCGVVPNVIAHHLPVQ